MVVDDGVVKPAVTSTAWSNDDKGAAVAVAANGPVVVAVHSSAPPAYADAEGVYGNLDGEDNAGAEDGSAVEMQEMKDAEPVAVVEVENGADVEVAVDAGVEGDVIVTEGEADADPDETAPAPEEGEDELEPGAAAGEEQ